MSNQLLYINSERSLQLFGFLINREPTALANYHLLFGTDLQYRLADYDQALTFSKLTSEFINEQGLMEVVVLTPSGNFKTCINDLRKLESKGLQIKVLPKFGAWKNGSMTDQVYSNFTTRSIIKYDCFTPIEVKDYYRNKTIVITGAGGSIGSQLSSLATLHYCKKLILVDHSELAIYYLKQKLKEIQGNRNIGYFIADVRDKERLTELFKTHRPDIVFHLAACKHAGLMEINGHEAFKTNVLGTKNLLEVSNRFHCTHFNFISTDKAVNPACIMGITKFIGESYVLNTPCNGNLKVNILRFGNVLGSSGSVVETFSKALTQKQPLHITNAKMCRYFITEEDAANFIWSAPVASNHRDIIVFNSVEQTEIIELAKLMLVLNGDVEFNELIRLTQTREPWEKLSEQLYESKETARDTPNKQIKVIPGNELDPKAEKLVDQMALLFLDQNKAVSFSDLIELLTQKQP